MRAQPLGAVLSISIDLPTLATKVGAGSRDSEKSTVARLLELIAASGQCATWFSADPANDESIGRATAAGAGHEAALRVDADWAGDGGGRNRFVGEVVARTAQSRRAGMPVTTLTLPDKITELPSELLVKYGITAIRTATEQLRAGRARSGSVGPVPLRYGLWRFADDFRLVGGSRIADWRASFGIRRAIDRCVRSEAPLHLAIDAVAIAANSSLDRLGGLPAILRHIVRRRSAGQLRVCTIAQMVAGLAAPSAPRASGSILHAA